MSSKDVVLEEIEKLIEQAGQILGHDIQETLRLTTLAYQKSLQMGYAQGRVKAAILWGNALNVKGTYDEALLRANEGLALAKEMHMDADACTAFNVIGTIYSKLGQLDLALDHYQRGLDLSKTCGDPHLDSFLNNIAVVYSKQNQLDRAFACLQEILFRNKNTNPQFRGFVLTNIAEVQVKLGKLEEALRYNQQAFDLLKDEGAKWIYKIQCHKVFGKIYYLQSDFSKALVHFEVALSVAQQMGDFYRTSSVLLELGRMAYVQGDYTRAISYIHQSLELSQNHSAEIEVMEAYQCLSKALEAKGQHKEALEALRCYIDLSDKLKSKSLASSMAANRAQLNYERQLLTTAQEQMKNQTYQGLAHIGKKIASSKTLEEVLKQTFWSLQEELSIYKLKVYYLQANGEYWLLESYLSPSNQEAFTISTIKPLDLPNIVTQALLQTHVELFEDSGSLCYVLSARKTAIGLLSIERALEHWQPGEHAFLEMLGGYVAIALQNAFYAQELEHKHDSLKVLSHTDMLTGLYNRRLMIERLEATAALSARKQKPYAIAMADVDFFKAINDTYGHQAGDEVLKAIAQTIRPLLRVYDVLARWGGEEFVILMPDTSLKEAYYICKRVQSAINALTVAYKDQSISFTITLGLASCQGNMTWEDMMNLADANLYRGKKQGRNCIIKS